MHDNKNGYSYKAPQGTQRASSTPANNMNRTAQQQRVGSVNQNTQSGMRTVGNASRAPQNTQSNMRAVQTQGGTTGQVRTVANNGTKRTAVRDPRRMQANAESLPTRVTKWLKRIY